MKKLRQVSRVQCCAPRSVCFSVSRSSRCLSALLRPTKAQVNLNVTLSQSHTHTLRVPGTQGRGCHLLLTGCPGMRAPVLSSPTLSPLRFLTCSLFSTVRPLPAHCLLVPQPLNDHHTPPSPLRTYITDLLTLRTKLTPLRSPFLSQLIKHLVPSSVTM